MEAARKEGDGNTQVYLKEREATIQPEDHVTYTEPPEGPMNMKSDGSHMTGRVVQLTLEIIYLLTGEDYMMVRKTSGDHVTSSRCSIEDLHPPSLRPERANKKILEIISQIIELLTGEVGDVSHNAHHCDDEDLCDGEPSSLDCSEARNLALLPISEACDDFVAQRPKNVDKERLLIECKSQNNTMVDGASNGDCNVTTLTDKQTANTVSLLSGNDLHSHQGWTEATKGTQTEWPSTYILVYNTNALESQTPVIKINTAVNGFDKKLANISGQRTYKNALGNPNTDREQQRANQEEWTCIECGKTFSCKSHLTKHQRMHKERSCHASKFSKTVSGIANFGGHLAVQREKMSQIDSSNKCYDSHISRHQRVQNEENVCQSFEAIKTFGGPSDLAECEVDIWDYQSGKCLNGERQEDNLEGGFDCQKSLVERRQKQDMACLELLTYKSQLIRHRKIHSSEKLFLCSECGKRFGLKSALLRHQMIHSGEKPFACTICGNCFNQRSHYIRHQLSHSGKKPFTCSDCDRSFIQKSDLVKHQKGHRGKKMSCPVCRKEFCSKTFLIKHQKSHGESSRAVCSECGKCFSQKSALVVHQRIHTGEKPFSCDDCGKLFNRKSLLVRHQRVHTGEKPFSCRECGKSFTRTTNLVIHQRTHSGERPFSCLKCSKSFNSNATLLRHQRTHGEGSGVSASPKIY
ncbi:uncharacterized protein ACMZJ9_015368 [Mantella aurantiaca]